MSKFQNDAIFWVDVDKIDPNPYQPRRDFNEDGLRDLAESIRQYGVLQPLTVTRNEETKDDGGLKVYYELIAGERRLRAAKMANLSQVPVTIRDEKEDAEVKLELAIIENLQREDLNPIERAEAFNQLSEEFDFTHKEIAGKIGKSREYVSNSMRLLKLPEKIKQAVMSGKIAEGHARPVLMLRDTPEKQEQLFNEIIHQDLTVREAEKRARRDAQDKVRKKENKIDPETKALEDELSDTLGTRVQIEKKDKGGKLVIDFFSDEDLESLIEMVKNNEEASMDDVMQEYANALNGDDDKKADDEGEKQDDKKQDAQPKTEEDSLPQSDEEKEQKTQQQTENDDGVDTDKQESQSMAETLGSMIQQARAEQESSKKAGTDKESKKEPVKAQASNTPEPKAKQQEDTDKQQTSKRAVMKDESTTENRQPNKTASTNKADNEDFATEEVNSDEDKSNEPQQDQSTESAVNTASGETGQTDQANQQDVNRKSEADESRVTAERVDEDPRDVDDQPTQTKPDQREANSTTSREGEQESSPKATSDTNDQLEETQSVTSNQEPDQEKEGEDTPDAQPENGEVEETKESTPEDNKPDTEEADEEDDMYSVSNFSV